MAKKNVKVTRFVDNKATTKVRLVFEEDGDSQADDFKLRYTAVSPKRQREIDDWAEEFDRAQARRDQEREAELRQARRDPEREAELRQARAAGAGQEALDEIERRYEAGVDQEALDEIERRYDAEERYALAEYLVMMGVELPEIVGDDEKPTPITADLLAGFEAKNLVSIREAIRRDVNPNVTPSAA